MKIKAIVMACACFQLPQTLYASFTTSQNKSELTYIQYVTTFTFKEIQESLAGITPQLLAQLETMDLSENSKSKLETALNRSQKKYLEGLTRQSKRAGSENEKFSPATEETLSNLKIFLGNILTQPFVQALFACINEVEIETNQHLDIILFKGYQCAFRQINDKNTDDFIIVISSIE